ncbi:MAG TPA: hypothetical protein VKD25_09055 [Burkholderiales bacterium]|nr:hypothetical protein [Burkholderiales bacterium]
MKAAAIAVAGLLCAALSGCHATLYGNQTTVNGTTTTTTATQVSGSTKFAGGRASFSSGQPIPAGAPGGTLKVSGSAAGAVVLSVVFLDFFSYMVGPSQPKPLAPDTRIADTCSCYRKTSDEVTK